MDQEEGIRHSSFTDLASRGGGFCRRKSGRQMWWGQKFGKGEYGGVLTSANALKGTVGLSKIARTSVMEKGHPRWFETKLGGGIKNRTTRKGFKTTCPVSRDPGMGNRKPKGESLVSKDLRPTSSLMFKRGTRGRWTKRKTCCSI